MAEPLKHLMGPPIVAEIAKHLGRTGAVDAAGFEADALASLETLELMDRIRHVAAALSRHLPADYPQALDTLRTTLHPEIDAPLDAMTLDGKGLRGWSVAPFGEYVAQNGLDSPEQSLAFLREMTQRFSAEFAVRPFLRDHSDLALKHAETWSRDANLHVRRLASEGTRPRLPWGLRLTRFIQDPAPLIPLLTTLRDDPEDYVRRSVANSLNDIAKDHPDLIATLAADWLQDAPPKREKLVKHACRTLIKAGHPATHATFGYTPPSDIYADLTLAPKSLTLGDTLTIDLTLTTKTHHALLIDLILHFRRANGSTSPKVFKWTETEITPGTPLSLTKRLPLRPVTTRRHYPGAQEVEVQVNGQSLARARFDLHVPG